MLLIKSRFKLPDMVFYYSSHDWKEVVCKMLHQLRLENLGLSDFRDSLVINTSTGNG